jgi:hypothetical protein
MDMQSELRGEVLHVTLTGKVDASRSAYLINRAFDNVAVLPSCKTFLRI